MIAISDKSLYHKPMIDLHPILSHLPYKLTAYDAKGNYLYDNGGSDGSFFPDGQQNLPDWIKEELLASPEKSLSYPIPSDSFETILMQTYQAALTSDGELIGFWETIFDLKGPLEAYLDSSAQALVAWSDTTSGASFTIDDTEMDSLD